MSSQRTRSCQGSLQSHALPVLAAALCKIGRAAQRIDPCQARTVPGARGRPQRSRRCHAVVALGDTLPFLSSPASMRSTETVCRKSCWISSSRAHCTFTGRQAVESQSRQLAVPKPKRKSAGLKRGAEVCTGSETEAPRRRSEISDDWLNDGL